MVTNATAKHSFLDRSRVVERNMGSDCTTSAFGTTEELSSVPLEGAR